MYCPQCGSNISDGVSFCPQCGARIDGAQPDAAGAGTAPETASAPVTPAEGAGAPASEPRTPANVAGNPAADAAVSRTAASAAGDPGTATPASPDASATPAADTFKAQVTRAQARSKRRLPVLLIVILVTLALAATAFAATYIYQNIILPQLEEQAQRDAEANLAAEQDAEAEAQADEDAAQRAVYDDILTTYRDSQAQDWANASSSTLNDLASLGVIVDLQEDMNVSVTYDELTSGTVAYAYTDLGNDGTLDLVIGVLTGNGDGYKLIGAFSTDGNGTTSLMNGSLLMRTTWDVTHDGYLRSTGADGASTGSVILYTVEDGTAVVAQRLTYSGDSYFSYNEDGTTSPSDAHEYQLAANAAETKFDLDWTPLADFEPAGDGA